MAALSDLKTTSEKEQQIYFQSIYALPLNFSLFQK